MTLSCVSGSKYNWFLRAGGASEASSSKMQICQTQDRFFKSSKDLLHWWEWSRIQNKDDLTTAAYEAVNVSMCLWINVPLADVH